MFQSPKVDLEAAAQAQPQYFILRARARRISTATTVCLLLTALLVLSVGIIGGAYLYPQFARSQVSRSVCCLFLLHVSSLVLSCQIQNSAVSGQLFDEVYLKTWIISHF